MRELSQIMRQRRKERQREREKWDSNSIVYHDQIDTIMNFWGWLSALSPWAFTLESVLHWQSESSLRHETIKANLRTQSSETSTRIIDNINTLQHLHSSLIEDSYCIILPNTSCYHSLLTAYVSPMFGFLWFYVEQYHQNTINGKNLQNALTTRIYSFKYTSVGLAGTLPTNHTPSCSQAVQHNRTDPREYAGNPENSPLYDVCLNPQAHSNLRRYDDNIVIIDDANAKVCVYLLSLLSSYPSYAATH